VTVPDVVNLTQSAATSAITGAGLVVGTVTSQSSGTVPSGSVISQSPVSGTSVAAGSAVNLVVSTGPANVTVPDVVNLTQAAATSAITGAGLVVGTVTSQSSTVPLGSVISQSPLSGTSVAAGSAVNLVVSTGPANVTVPDVVNLTQSAATSAITGAGLVVGTVTSQSSGTVAAGSVISQSPVSGTSVAAGSAVDLVVSTGPAIDTQAPSQPTGFTSSKVSGNPRLTWTASTDNVGVAGYRIHRSTNGSFGPVFTTTTSTTWTDTDVIERTRYTYAIVAFDAAGNSSARSVLRSVTAGAAPTAPTTLRATLVNGNTQVQLTWNASTDNVGVVEYIVYRGTSGNVLGPEVARVATPGWVDTTVTTGSGVRYTYAVKARDAANYLSGRSNWSSVTVP
jgi:beta-lactam-binding protein with PASTA domain